MTEYDRYLATKEQMQGYGGVRAQQPPPGEKHDQNKQAWHLFPFRAAEEVVRVLEYGAKKYAPNNWKLVEDAERRYVDAAMRHLVAHLSGELRDPESGCLHLAHAGCSLLFAIHFMLGLNK